MFLRAAFLTSLALCSALYSDECSRPAGTHRIFQFENEHVRVWKTVIMPNQPLKMHRHDCARVMVGLKEGILTRIEETGECSEIPVEFHKACWLESDPPNTLHADVNLSDEPIEVMIIEVKALDASGHGTGIDLGR